MPRPAKPKTVCRAEDFFYGCRRHQKILNMSHEELETIRLIDVEKFTQQGTAEHMNISRATVQSLYELARETLGLAHIEKHGIFVSGGNYRLCNEKDHKEKRGCKRYNQSPQHTKEMVDSNEKI